MSQRDTARHGSLRITDGQLPAGLKAWGFSAESGAAFTALEIDNSGFDDKAKHGWDSAFASEALQTVEYGSVITNAIVTGTITFYLSNELDSVAAPLANLLQGAIQADFPAGFTEERGKDFVRTRTTDGQAVGSYLTYYSPNALAAKGQTVTCQFTIKSINEIDLPVYLISLKDDGTNTAGNTRIDRNVNKVAQTLFGGRLISETPADNARYCAIALENYNDDKEVDIDIDGISFKVHNDPPAQIGVGQSYIYGDGNPDNVVLDANHSIAVDLVNQKLVLTATGAGTSYFTWNRNFDQGANTNGQAYILLGSVTAPGAVVNPIKGAGIIWFATTLTPATDEEYLESTQLSMETDESAYGIGITTTGAGVVEIKKFAFVTGVLNK